MALALISFWYGRKKLSTFAYTVPNPLKPGEGKKLLGLAVVIAVVATVLVVLFQLLLGELTSAIAWALFLFALGTAGVYFVTMVKSPRSRPRSGCTWAPSPRCGWATSCSC